MCSLLYVCMCVCVDDDDGLLYTVYTHVPLFVCLVVFCFVPPFPTHYQILAWTWAGLAWVQYFYNLNFERHLIHVRRAFAHKELFRAVRLRQTLLPNNGHTNGLRGSWLQATDETTFLKRSLERTGSCQASTRSILLPHENDNSDDEEEQLLSSNAPMP